MSHRFLQARLTALLGFVFLAASLPSIARATRPPPPPATCDIVTTLAGLARSTGSTDDDGSAARFNGPVGLAVRGVGVGASVYVADSGNAEIRQMVSHIQGPVAGGIPPTIVETVTTLAGSAGASGNVNGVGALARFANPTAAAVGGDGTVYVADTGNNAIRVIAPNGTVTTLPLLPGSVALNGPMGIALDSAGTLYVANTNDQTILKITAGIASVLAGASGVPGNTDGTGAAANFNYPQGIAVDSGGNVYVADTDNSLIRVISPSGAVTSFAGGPTGPGGPVGITPSPSSFLGLMANGMARLGLTPNIKLPPPPPQFQVFYSPTAVAVDAAGYVYVANTGANTIVQIAPDGTISTLAGLASSAGSAEGTLAAARFNAPQGIAVDAAGTLFVADSGNATVRQIVPCPLISNFTPASGLVGSSVTITGRGFSATNTVTFSNGVVPGTPAASITASSHGALTVTVPPKTTTAPITIVTATGTATSSASFAVILPTITGLSRSSATVGTSLVISGTLFDPIATNNQVLFNNSIPATVTAATSTTLTLTVPSGAITGVITVINGYGQAVSPSPFLVIPTISGFTPPGGKKADSITISGTGFDANPANDTVKFFNATANVTAATATTLTVTVPLGATTGPITVTTPGGTATSSPTNFLVIPVINSLGATGAAVGDSLSIYGSGYDFSPLNDTVTFYNGVTATVTAASAGVLTVQVPLGATTGPITVATAGGVATSPSFTVMPKITNLNPTRGAVGDAVTITGTTFSANPANDIVKFASGMQPGGAQATVSAANSTSLSVTVPPGAGSGFITVTTPDGTASSTVAFTIEPSISSLGSTQGAEGTSVAIHGNALSPYYTIKFNGVSATVISATDTLLNVSVPSGATTGYVTVTAQDNYTATSSQIFTVVPAITGLNFTQGAEGAGVIITGTTFLSSDTVKFNGKAVSGGTTTATTHVVTVPIGATTGTVTVTTVGGYTTTSSQIFTVVPAITGLNFTQGAEGAGVIITGTTFLSSDTVKFNGKAVSGGTTTATTHVVTVPIGATTGTVTVTTVGGYTTTSSQSYTVVPAITGLNFTQGAEGAGVIITGTTFLSSDTVKFNGTAVSGGTTTATTHIVTVPSGATTGTVTVTTVGGYTTTSSQIYTVVPKITTLNITSGAVGSPVTINGTTFLSSDTVKFNGTAVTGGTTTATTHIVNVPVGATTGTVTVTTVDGYTDTSAQIFTVTVVPNPPASITVPATNSGTSVTITWTAPVGGAAPTSYTLQRKTGAGGQWGVIRPSIPLSPTTLVDSVPGEGTYFYEIAACNGGGCGANTVSTSGVVVTYAPLPALPTAVNDTLPAHDATVGTMAGQAGVDGGAATYTVPIEVPPGRAGMQPSLSLNYNSRSGNGVMGLGWSLSGTSSIHRCPQTPEQDGQTLGVSYSSTDRLCLDGQRLVPINGGTYGAAGTQYATEVDSYARITQIGGGLTGSSTCFRVEQKDGRQLDYGAVITTALSCGTSTSRVLPNSAAGTLSWLAEKIQDRVGNTQLFTYSDYSGGYGEVLLQSITYTGSAATVGDRKVTFAYQPRTTAASGVADIASSYLAGGLTMQTQALQSITTSVAGITARTYQPNYVVAAYSQRLLMASMQECAGSGCLPNQTTCVTSATRACHAPTAFMYNDSVLYDAAATNSASTYPFTSLNGLGLPDSILLGADGVTTNPYHLTTVADLDGDGTRETIAAVTQGGVTHTYLIQLTGDRKSHGYVDVTGTPFSSALSDYADIDGSGRSALMEPPPAGTAGFLSFDLWSPGRGAIATTNPLFTVASNIALGIHGAPYTAADFNGDGKIDIVVLDDASSCGSGRGVFVWLNTTVGAVTVSNPPTFTLANNGLPLLCLSLNDTVNPRSGTHEAVVQNIDHIADFDGNGVPDFYLTTTTASDANGTTSVHFDGVALLQSAGNNTLSVTQKNCFQIGLSDSRDSSPTDQCTWSTHVRANGVNQTIAIQWLDMNGDGLEDLVIARPIQGTDPVTSQPYPSTWRVVLNHGGTMGAEIDTHSTDGLDKMGLSPNSFRYTGKLPTIDVDGDGKPDILIPSTTQGLNGFAMKMCRMISVPAEPANGNCPGDSLKNSPTARGGFCPVYTCPEDPGTTHDTLPYANGIKPPEKSNGYDYLWNGFPVARTYGGLAGIGLDDSLYHLAMLKFVQTDATHGSMRLIETPLTARLNDQDSTASDDLFGDGLPDLLTQAGCGNVKTTNGIPSNNTYWSYNRCSVVGDGTYGPATLPDGITATCTRQPDGSCYFDTHVQQFASINQGVPNYGGSLSIAPSKLSPGFPDLVMSASGTSLGLDFPKLPGLIDQATNGVGDTANWSLLPLSVPGSQGDVPIYSLAPVNGSTTGYVDSRHYYFTSSMPVVLGFTQSSGFTNPPDAHYFPGQPNNFGFRGAIYGYSEAMYNHLGRGFQGFRTITSEMTKTPQDDDLSRVVRTKTIYNQKFPLAGKVAGVEMRVPQANPLVGGDDSSERLIHSETTTWGCTRSNRNVTCAQGDTLVTPTSFGAVQQPFLNTQIAHDYDLTSGTETSEVDTVNAATTASSVSGWDNYANACNIGSGVYGNLTGQVVTRMDKSSGGIFVDSHTTTTAQCYDVSDSADWWINKLTGTTETRAITYAAGHPAPQGALSSQTVTTGMTWNTSDRTPATKILQAGVSGQQSTTSYTYPTPSYGSPSRVSVVVPATDLGTALSPTRTTGFTYTTGGTTAETGGYFVYATTRDPDGLNQTTTTQHQTSDGQVTLVSDPNHVKTRTTYDVFGRPTQIDYLDSSDASSASSTQLALKTCSSGNCGTSATLGEDGLGETNAAYRLTTVRSGYPTQVVWYDLLGRAIKQAERGYDGIFIDRITDYDKFGTVQDRSTPFVKTGLFYLTGYSYDRLNRMVQKIDPVDVQIDPHGDRITEYSYSGRTTNIRVCTITMLSSGLCPAAAPSGAGNLYLNMSRSSNVLGQVMQTSDALGGLTNYWTDPQGHVVAMTDAESNLTTASYNALGQRTNSNDPDQGAWSFSYDALGELTAQTDARGVTTTVNKRDALGRTTEQQQVPPATITNGVANETLLDDWTYDSASNGIGQLATATRRRGTGTSVPAQSAAAVWSETLQYDSASRPTGNTRMVNEGSAVTLSDSQSYDTSGRPKIRTYPSNIAIQTLYAGYGLPGGMANATTGQIYWEATAQDAWGKTTAESYLDGTTGSLANYASTGQAHTASWSLNGSVVDSLTYTYDSLGNLLTQQRGTANSASNTETYSYDALQRLTRASRSGGTVNYGYSPAGNLRYKDDYSTKPAAAPWAYQYGTQVGSISGACGPHGAMSVSLAGSGTASYQCDAIGNVIGGNTLSASYDADNHPRTVTRSGIGSTGWAYGADGERDYETSSEGSRYFGASGYEQVGTKQIHELGPIILTSTGGTITGITIALRDRLGSTIDTIDNGAATIANARTYDAFGAVRDGNMNSRTGGTLNLGDTKHGFTQHEHADDVRLIHMGGRIYDYTLGRFLNVDPVIGNPLSSQSLNPYSYIGNNPLSGTDPTGYIASSCVVSKSNSCTAPVRDSRSADPLAHTTYNMGSDNNVRAYNSQGGSSIVVNNGMDAGATAKGASSTPLNGQASSIGAQSGTVNGTASTTSQNAPSVAMSKNSQDEGKFEDDMYEHATNDLEKSQFAAENKSTISGVISTLAEKFPQLKPYLRLSDAPYIDSDGSWHWNGNSIDINSMAISGEIKITSTLASVLVAHEALHGLVYTYDPSYSWHAFKSGLLFQTDSSDPSGGRPHLWVQNKGMRVGVWADAGERLNRATPRPDISAQSYWACLDGGGCK